MMVNVYSCDMIFLSTVARGKSEKTRVLPIQASGALVFQ